MSNTDGYQFLNDGYNICSQQLNVRLSEKDIEEINTINNTLFEGECTNSMMGRILIRKGLQWYKNLKQ